MLEQIKDLRIVRQIIHFVIKNTISVIINAIKLFQNRKNEL